MKSRQWAKGTDIGDIRNVNVDEARTCWQAKQRRKDRKEKDKEAEEKRVRVEQETRQRPSDLSRAKEQLLKERNILLHSPADVGEEEDDLSGVDTVDNVIVGTLGPATEDGDVDRTSWDREGSCGQSGMEAAGFSGALLEEGSIRNSGIGQKHHASVLDDSSSTCSSDSLPSVRPCMNGSYNSGPSVPEHDHVVSSRCVYYSYMLLGIMWFLDSYDLKLLLLNLPLNIVTSCNTN